MEIFVYIMLFLLAACNAYAFYKINTFNKLIESQKAELRKQLIETGNAIADTLKVVFDNLKRQGSKIEKSTNKDTEYQSRFHRIEQNIQRILSNMANEDAAENKEIKNERRNNKTN